MIRVSDEARFWQWFENNSERLQTTVFGTDGQARERAMRELAEVSQEAAPGLVLEFCKGQEGNAHALIVSVDGNRNSSMPPSSSWMLLLLCRGGTWLPFGRATKLRAVWRSTWRANASARMISGSGSPTAPTGWT